MLYDLDDLTSVLQSYKTGGLDSFVDAARPGCGIKRCKITSRGLVGMTLIELATIETVSNVLMNMLSDGGEQELAIALIMVEFYGLTTPELGRVLGHDTAYKAMALLMDGRDRFVERLVSA